MTSGIPPEIREQVLTLWLKAYSRDELAKTVGIGSGTVSEIVEDYIRRNPGFELLREFVIAIRKEGINVRHFASAIRLQQLLESHSLTAEQIESFISNAATQCFKREEDLNKFREREHDSRFSKQDQSTCRRASCSYTGEGEKT